MGTTPDMVILSSVSTAVGSDGGSPKSIAPCDIAVGGGVECMSRAGYTSTSKRWGHACV